jgi:hypothetical protein
METPNTQSLSSWWTTPLQVKDDDILRAFRGFNAYAKAFHKESENHER